MHIATQHYWPRFDFPKFVGERRELVMLASIPRSGSTFLALEMWKTGVLGSPLEYLNFELLFRVGRWRHSVIDLHQYWADVQALRTSSNGIFSFKMFPANYRNLSNLDEKFLAEICPTKVIYLQRKDRIAQAISYSRAIKSGAWFAGVEEDLKLEYDKQHITICEDSIKWQHEFWMKAFDLTNADVLTVYYEDLLSEPDNVLKVICNYLNVQSTSESRLDIEGLSVQRGEENLEWETQYRSEQKHSPLSENSTP